MKRLISFDYIRAISIIGIVLCHCCYGISGMSFLGSFLGSTFNVVFLSLSAFLLGLSWEHKGNLPYGISFLTHRISKLAYSYYPFLLGMFGFLALTGYRTSIKDWAMHLFFLPWFDKLPGFGHLWFITMIVICYIGVYVISNFIRFKLLIYIALIGGGIAGQYVLGRMGLPNYLFLYLALYLCVFLNASKIIQYVDKLALLPLVLIGVIAFPVIIALYYWDVLSKYTSVWAGIVSAILFFVLSSRIFSNAKSNRVVDFISSISFEIYLVHHVFCFGKYSLFRMIENPILGTLAIMLLSVLLAYPLHLFADKIRLLFEKRG